jgi:hypothetical protein
MGDRLGAVVVCDIVGSTALRARLGDTRMEELRRRVDAVIAHAVELHGGSVRAWLGDGCEAVFPSATDALRAAGSMAEWTARDNHRLGRAAAVELRIGVDAGPVEAATAGAHQLCGSAGPSRILALPRLIRLAGSWADWETVPDGAAVELRWRDAGPAEHLGRPPRFEHPSDQLLAGRSRERAVLEQAIGDAREGRGSVVVLAGDGGLGKSRLAHHLVDRAGELGFLLLAGSFASGQGNPHQAIAEWLDQWASGLPEVRIRLGRDGPELARLSPQIAALGLIGEPGTGDAVTDRLRLHRAVVSWVEEVATTGPALFVVENAHLAGEAAAGLLAAIAGTVRQSRAVMLCTTRSIDERDVLTSSLEPDHQLVLGPLDDAATAALVGSVAPGLDAAEVRHLVARSGGNALFAVELARHRLSGADPTSMPATVQRATADRVAALEPATFKMLQAAAVLGPEFELKAIAEMIDMRDELYDALDGAVDAGVLTEPAEPDLVYRFVHDFIRQALYDELGAARRTRLHERAGLTLERLGGVGSGPARLAEHFAAAAPLGHRERAARHALAAGREAQAAFALDEAAGWYRRGLDLVGPGETELRADLLTGLGGVARTIGLDGWREWIDEAATIAEALGDGVRLGEAALAGYRGTFTRALRVDRTKVERLRRALELIPGDDLSVRARLHSALGLELEWSPDASAARAESDTALEIAERLGDERLLATVLSHRLWTLYHPTRLRLEATRRLLELTDRLGSPMLRFEAAGLASFTAIRRGDPVEIEGHFATLTELSQQLDVPLVRWQLLLRQWPWMLATGRYEEASGIADEHHRLGIETGHPDREQAYATQRFWLDFDRRESGASREFFSMMLQIVDQVSPVAWPAWGHVMVELGMGEEAAEILARVQASTPDADRRDQLFLVRLFDLAVLAESMGDAALGARLAAAIEPRVDLHANMVFVTYGSMARAMGLAMSATGDRDAALHWLRVAAERNRDAGLAAWEARALLDLARLDPGRRSDVRSRVSEICGTWGLPVIAERAASLPG